MHLAGFGLCRNDLLYEMLAPALCGALHHVIPSSIFAPFRTLL